MYARGKGASLAEQIGVILESGLEDWRILQQDETGHGTLVLRGRWVGDPAGRVECRIVYEETGAAPDRSLDWREAATSPDGTWSAEIGGVPAGGLYRLETRLNVNASDEWSVRGDLRHFFGVGDLWIIAGQSNSAGYGRGPISDPPELGVHLFRNSERWALASHPMNESTDTRHPANREAGNPGHSPYLQFAKALKARLGYPVGLVQTALGGSPLSAWNPTENEDAALYRNMLHCVERAGGRVKGLLWYQGESDAGGANADTYADRFIRAAESWRAALNRPDLPIVTVQLNRVLGPASEEGDRGWSKVREAQRQVPRRLSNVAVVPALDLPLSDGIHISPSGNLQLGDRMARAALGMAYGSAADYRAPDLASARRLSGGRIELRFDAVTRRMDSIDRMAQPFKIEDESGDVPIREVIYPLDSTIHLVLGRETKGKTVVHGGYGFNPPVVPVDSERLIPMLGFYGVPVE
jgi:hypothetical protein